MPTSGNFLEASEIPWENIGEGRRRQILCYQDDLMLIHFEFETGAVGEPHTHPHSQCAYIKSGVFDVTIKGVTRRLGAGSSYVVDGGVLHGAVCIEAGTMIDAFTPHRDDYLGET
ncbi:cupin domain-containing protein [Corticibacterium sp. UT-5YL-CI-8]|nr:cupin domain-containing protein [Tianweitania sp. UT-5YL-CI-8]